MIDILTETTCIVDVEEKAEIIFQKSDPISQPSKLDPKHTPKIVELVDLTNVFENIKASESLLESVDVLLEHEKRPVKRIKFKKKKKIQTNKKQKLDYNLKNFENNDFRIDDVYIPLDFFGVEVVIEPIPDEFLNLAQISSQNPLREDTQSQQNSNLHFNTETRKRSSDQTKNQMGTKIEEMASKVAKYRSKLLKKGLTNKLEEEFIRFREVEKIVKHVEKNGRKSYKVRWHGFSPADDTWLDEKILRGPIWEIFLQGYWDNQSKEKSFIEKKEICPDLKNQLIENAMNEEKEKSTEKLENSAQKIGLLEEKTVKVQKPMKAQQNMIEYDEQMVKTSNNLEKMVYSLNEVQIDGEFSNETINQIEEKIISIPEKVAVEIKIQKNEENSTHFLKNSKEDIKKSSSQQNEIPENPQSLTQLYMKLYANLNKSPESIEKPIENYVLAEKSAPKIVQIPPQIAENLLSPSPTLSQKLFDKIRIQIPSTSVHVTQEENPIKMVKKLPVLAKMEEETEINYTPLNISSRKDDLEEIFRRNTTKTAILNKKLKNELQQIKNPVANWLARGKLGKLKDEPKKSVTMQKFSKEYKPIPCSTRLFTPRNDILPIKTAKLSKPCWKTSSTLSTFSTLKASSPAVYNFEASTATEEYTSPMGSIAQFLPPLRSRPSTLANNHNTVFSDEELDANRRSSTSTNAQIFNFLT